MNKQQFLNELSEKFAAVPHGEAWRILSFYSEAIDDRMEDGMSEADAVAAMGSAESIAREVLGDAPPRRTADEAGRVRFAADGGSDGERDGAYDRYFDPDGLRTITVQEQGDDVYVRPSPDGKVHVLCEEPQSLSCTLEDGTLRIARQSERHTGRFLGFSFHYDTTVGDDVQLLLPEGCAPALSIQTASGDAEIGVPALEALRVQTAGGDVGATELRVARTAEITTASGDVGLHGLTCEKLLLTTASGDAEITDLNAREANLNTVSGDVDLTGGRVEEALTSHAISGDLTCRLDGTLAQGRFESVSGDVSLHLGGSRETYRVTVRSAGRSERSMGPADGRPVLVKTVSGDVEFGFDE